MTARALLNPRAADHLRKLCGLLGSNHDGEVINAARLADQFVRRLGLTWGDVITTPPNWQLMAKVCCEHMHVLTPREREFIDSISRSRRAPSDKQLIWLTDIFERLRGMP